MNTDSKTNNSTDNAGHGLASGQTIAGRYFVEGLIGRGSFSHVYRVIDTQNNDERVALKVLKHRYVEDDTVVNAFRNEARLLALVHSPYTVQALDFGSLEDGTPWFIMDYLPGRTIKTVLSRYGGFHEGDVLRFARFILRGLAACHDSGVIHRDIKPSNVQLARSGRTGQLVARILDFGIAVDRDASSAEQSSLAYCTPQYAAPEVTKGYASTSQDLYSAAVMFAEMLDGGLPESLLKVKNPSKLPADNVIDLFSEELQASRLAPVLRRATQSAPELRYHSADQMLRDLEDCVADRFVPGADALVFDKLPNTSDHMAVTDADATTILARCQKSGATCHTQQQR